jgi:hypothetical protein
MKFPITHERCSELLGDYATGELSSAERSLVDDHLTGCADCAAERDALVALTAPEVEPRTDRERAELRASVLDGIATSDPSTVLADETDAVIVPIGGWRSKATKYIGVAAMLAILAVGFVYLGNIVTGDSAQDAAGGGTEQPLGDAGSGGGEAEDSTPKATREGEDNFSVAEDQYEELQSGRLSKDFFLNSEPAPVFEDDQGDLSLGALDELARRPVFRSFSEVYTVRQARRSINPSLAALAETAPRELASAVTNCGHAALGDLADPGLLAYATTGRVDDRDSLVLGFVTGTRSLDRYRFVTFQFGDCRTIVRSLGGPIP